MHIGFCGEKVVNISFMYKKQCSFIRDTLINVPIWRQEPHLLDKITVEYIHPLFLTMTGGS